MTITTKRILIIVSLLLASSVGTYIVTYEGELMVEFSGADGRDAFTKLLTQHVVSYQLETDHLERIWVIPNQSKRAEYEQVMDIYMRAQEQKVRKLNEKNRLF